MKSGVVGLLCEETTDGILISRCYGGVSEEFTAHDFKEASDFLLEHYPDSLYVTWNIRGFASDLFTLLPDENIAELKNKSKTHYADTKIFSVDRMVGLTGRLHSKGNFYDAVETNIYGLHRWIPDTIDKPTTAQQVAELGEQLLDTLELIGIDPDKLTSPVAVIDNELREYNLPTLWSNDDELFIDACNYALKMSHYEWRQEFKSAKEVYNYDQISAYPFYISRLPDTDHCKIRHWKSLELLETADWGIMKGELEITASICPIPCQTRDGGYVFCTNGFSDDEAFITTDELDWINRRNAGSFKMTDGYFFKFINDRKPYKEIVENLFKQRQTDNELLSDFYKKACFSNDTEVMTPDGLVKVDSLKINDKVYSINPKTFTVELKPIIGIKSYPHNGDMINFSNCKHDFLITPEHRMLLRRDCGHNYNFVEAKYLPLKSTSQWVFPQFSPIKGETRTEFDIWNYANHDAIVFAKPNKRYARLFKNDNRFKHSHVGYYSIVSKIDNPHDIETNNDVKLFIKNRLCGFNIVWNFNINDWLELMGWYISEGNAYKANTGKNCGIMITNLNIKPICDLLDRMNLKYGLKRHKSGVYQVNISHHAIYNYCVKECGVGSANKKIPQDFFSLNHTHLQYLWNSLMEGDGCKAHYKRTAKYTTKSKQLAYDFQRLCLHLGYNTQVKLETRNGNSPTRVHNPIYRIFIYKKPKYFLASTVKRKNIRTVPYKGLVWGIEVADNHTILAGRNGKLQFTGQSNGISGKLDQINNDGSYGELFNPVLASMVRSKCRVAVADFIYDNNLQDSITNVVLDGVKSTVKLDLPEIYEMGKWRLK